MNINAVSDSIDCQEIPIAIEESLLRLLAKLTALVTKVLSENSQNDRMKWVRAEHEYRVLTKEEANALQHASHVKVGAVGAALAGILLGSFGSWMLDGAQFSESAAKLTSPVFSVCGKGEEIYLSFKGAGQTIRGGLIEIKRLDINERLNKQQETTTDQLRQLLDAITQGYRSASSAY